LTLVVYLIMAVVNRVIYRWLGFLKYCKNIQEILDQYVAKRAIRKRADDDPVRLAVAFVTAASPERQRKLDGIENFAIFSYGIALLLIGYIHYLDHHVGRVFRGENVVPILFFILGFLHQGDFLNTVKTFIRRLVIVETEREEQHHSHGVHS
jgi:hypothetical protein